MARAIRKRQQARQGPLGPGLGVVDTVEEYNVEEIPEILFSLTITSCLVTTGHNSQASSILFYLYHVLYNFKIKLKMCQWSIIYCTDIFNITILLFFAVNFIVTNIEL
jgi:hypothetical protein